jgi:hypothetical protein
MEVQRTRAQDSERTAEQLAGRRSRSAAAAMPSPPAREVAENATPIASQLAGLRTEPLTVWNDAAQHALHDILDLSAQATQESTRRFTGWQQTNLELMREVQTAGFRWYTVWPEFFRDPIHGYRRSLQEWIVTTHRMFEMTRRNAEAIAQSYQRLERAADAAARTLGETLREALVSTTTKFAHGIRQAKEVDLQGVKHGDAEKEKLARQLVDVFSDDRDPKELKDTYADVLRQVIEAKVEEKHVAAAEGPKLARVTDLMETLQKLRRERPLAKAEGRRAAPARKRAASRRRRAA